MCNVVTQPILRRYVRRIPTMKHADSNTIIREIMRVMYLYQNAANLSKEPKVIPYQTKILNIFVVSFLFKNTLVTHKIHHFS